MFTSNKPNILPIKRLLDISVNPNEYLTYYSITNNNNKEIRRQEWCSRITTVISTDDKFIINLDGGRSIHITHTNEITLNYGKQDNKKQVNILTDLNSAFSISKIHCSLTGGKIHTFRKRTLRKRTLRKRTLRKRRTLSKKHYIRTKLKKGFKDIVGIYK